jgi:flagellar hook-associated protein 1 FlgK
VGLFSVLQIARDGVSAQSAALTTTSSNVANVATPGYARRTALLETGPNGSVRFARAERTFDRFSYAHVVDEQGKYGAANARSTMLAEIEGTIAPPYASIGDDATALVRAFNALSAFPIDPSLRADTIARAENLANKIAGTQASLGATSEYLLGRTRDTLTGVNARLKQIADLNQQIATAVGAGGDASALRDQRDIAVREVGEQIGARTIEDKSGRLTLFAAGAVLVEGDHASPLSMDLDPNNGNMRFYVQGAARTEITSRVTSGTIGGLREVRDTDLAKLQSDVDSYAYDVANAFNAVHTQGYGLDGTGGRPLFAIPVTKVGAAAAMAVDPAIVGHPERIGASGSAADVPGGNAIALQLGALADKQSIGGATLADRFAALATDIGFRKQTADAETELRTDTLAVAESLSNSADGVSLDEEMVNLSQYQRAFEASTRVLRTVDELLRGLLENL